MNETSSINFTPLAKSYKEAPYSGIYRCQNDGFEIVCVKGRTFRLRLQVGCPFKCDGYLCVDLAPIDEGVVKSEAVEWLEGHRGG
jgi:hypothetical protein